MTKELDTTRPVQGDAGYPVRILATDLAGSWPISFAYEINGDELVGQCDRFGVIAACYSCGNLSNVPEPTLTLELTADELALLATSYGFGLLDIMTANLLDGFNGPRKFDPVRDHIAAVLAKRGDK